MKTYALYKGDEFLFVGTKKECAEFLGVTERTISYFLTPHRLKLLKNPEEAIRVYRVEKGEEQ